MLLSINDEVSSMYSQIVEQTEVVSEVVVYQKYLS